MNRKLSALIFFLFVLTGFFACQYNEYLPEEEIIDPGITISFSEDIIPIFEAGCIESGCHSTGDIPPDLTAVNAYNSLLSNGYINVTEPANSELYQWMVGNRDLPMPLTGADAEANSKVLTWITQGALDN